MCRQECPTSSASLYAKLLTAENVAKKFNISREAQRTKCIKCRNNAQAAAQAAGKVPSEIVQ